MKKNFIASVDQDFWQRETKEKVITDPYVTHFLETQRLSTGAEFELLDFVRQRKEDLDADFQAAEEKYEKYLTALAPALDKIHGEALGEDFWRRALGLGLYRHITFLYDSYRLYSERFSPELHDARLLAEKCYFVPRDYAKQREFLQFSPFGQEQVFSLYARHFHHDGFWNRAEKVEKKLAEFSGAPVAAASRTGLGARLRYVLWQLQAARRDGTFLRLAKNKFLRKFSFKDSDVRLAIVESFFAPEHILTLENESRGRIRGLALPAYPHKAKITLDTESRSALASVKFPGMDDFDGFFFASLPSLFPTLLLEEFREHCDFYERAFAAFPNLGIVTCESFTSSAHSALALAVLRKKRAIHHLYNEHNCLMHQFRGDNLGKVAKIVDSFVTLGWKERGVPNLVPGASLFRFKTKVHARKEIPILYVTGEGYVRLPEFSSAYAFCAEKAPSYIDFVTRFFRALAPGTKRILYYRGYPTSGACMIWNTHPFLQAELPKLLRSEAWDKAKTAKELMGKARLVIVDYLSTSYLESLLSDVPTVVFWDREAYYLKDEHRDFYDGLVKAGIFQTNPEAAAKFVASIQDAPEEWWNHPATKQAKQEFLDRNFGKPETMLAYLLAEAGKPLENAPRR